MHQMRRLVPLLLAVPAVAGTVGAAAALVQTRYPADGDSAAIRTGCHQGAPVTVDRS